MEQKILTLAEKWEIDAQAYRDGASVITASPQCEKCRYDIAGNAMNCKKYRIKHKPIMFYFVKKSVNILKVKTE